MKITHLDELTAEAIDGTETLPVVKGGQSWRARLSALVDPVAAPYVADAAASADNARNSAVSAEGLVGPTFATIAAGLAATANGKPFAVRNANQTISVYLNTAGAAVLQRTIATTDALAAATGAALVSTAQGQTAQAALDHVVGAAPITPLARAQASAISLGAGQRAAGGGAAITSTAGGGMATLTGAGPSLRDMKLIGGGVASGTSVIGIGLANVSKSLLRDITIDLSASNGIDLPGVNIPTGLADHFSFGLNINTPGYGYLTNLWNTASAQDGHILMGFNIRASADAIEYNNPGNPLKHSVTWGGLLHAGYGGSGSGSGFALGIAHNQGWVAGGFVAKYSRREAVHIEDGCSFGVLSSLALRGCQYVGILASVGGAGANQAQATPLVISNFSAEGPGSGTAGSAGVYWVYDPSGYNNRWQLTSGYVKGFETGLWLDGLGVVPADAVTLDNCATVLKISRGQHHGRLTSNNAPTLLSVTSTYGGRAGRFVQSDSAPAKIIDNPAVGARAPRSTVDGFAFPAVAGANINVPSGQSAVNLFQIPVRMRGRLRISTVGSGFFWEGDVICADGLTINVIGTPIYEAVSNVAMSTFGSAGFTAAMVAGSPIVTISSPPAGWTLATGQTLVGTNIRTGTRILRQLSGTTGGAGDYLTDTPQPYSYTATNAATASATLQIGASYVQMSLYNAGGAVVIPAFNVEFDGTFYA